MRAFARLVLMCSVVLACAAQAFAQCGTIPIISPVNGETNVLPNIANTVTVNWTPVAGATSYDVYFGPPGACTAGPRATVVTSAFAPPAAEITPGTSYEWKVRAIGVACSPLPETACATFTTATAAACPSGPPALNAPANNAQVSFGTVTLQWTNVANATSYEVYTGIDGGALTSRGTTASTQKIILVGPGHTIEWKVVALSSTCPQQASPHFVFTTTCPTGTPIQQNPGNGTQFPGDTPISFAWDALIGANDYDLEVSPAGLNQWQTLAGHIAGTTFTATLAAGNWDWRIRANFEGTCSPSTSASRSLSVTATCNNQSPELTEPDRNATVKSPVTFKWTNVNALKYRLYTLKPDGTVPALLGTTTRTDFSAILDPGIYSWTVIAEFPNCPELPAIGRAFTVATDAGSCPANPGSAILLAPAANATNLTSPVTFTWQKVDGAKGYRLLAAFGSESIVTLGTTTGTSLTSAVPAGSGTWLVQTLFGDNCPTTLSERRTFNVSGGAQCQDTAPVPLTPPNGATNVDSPVTFKWSAVAGAISYRLYVAPGSDDFSFYGDTTETELERFVPTGTVHWYVLANFAACPDTRSNTVSFEVSRGACGDGTIELKSPDEGASTTSPVHLSWSGLSGSGNEYRVWVSADGSAPVTLARTTDTQATLNLPSGEITWYVDAPRTGCPTAISPKGHFTIARSTDCGSNQAPSLVSPAGTEAAPAQTTSPVTLSWNAVSNALGYRVWLSKTGQAFEDVALTRETHFQLDLDPAKYRWYVQALFEGCDPLSSSIAFFDVARITPRCPTGKATILTPAENGVTTSPVTISWTEVDQARKYRLFASRNGDSPVLLGTTSETSLDRALPPGQYVISIETVFEECPSTLSERRSFAIAESQNCSNEAATLVAPPNNAADVAEPVDFVWNPVSGAVKYALFVQANDGSPTAIAATDATQLTHVVPPGRIHWWVVTFFSGCDPTESEHFQFTIPRTTGCGTARPILLLPSDDARAVFSPVHFEWVSVPGAASYNVWLAQGDQFSIVATTTEPEADVVLDPGMYRWFVEVTFAECSPRRSAVSELTVRGPIACGRPDKPQAQVVGAAQSRTKYRVRWTPLANVGLYELQESTSPEFTGADTFSLASTSRQFSHEVTSTPVQYLYRVRGVSNCSDDRGPYSDVVGVFVIAPKTNNASAEAGAVDEVLQTIFLPGQGSPSPQFTATADKPWITISPSTGPLPPEGITLEISADPSVLDLGTNTATIVVNYTGAAIHGPATNGTTVTTVPVSVSLITPITPAGSSSPPPDSLIFPVVGHATGANDSLFESDIRVTNLTAQTIKYLIKFTPSGTDGTQTGSSSNVQIEPNQTLALDDIVSSLFGTGTTSSATGTLEVRPLTTSTSTSTGSLFSTVTSLLKPLNTAASSRTYNFTPTGTFGQFIPAIRFDEFVGKATSGPSTILSLQQVAESAAYRANFGFAEGSGQPVSLVARVYDTASNLLATIPVSLQAGEHKQINGMLSANGITNLADGRVEVEVVGGNGKVTAYVSEIDNQTNDPLLVDAAVKGGITSNRYAVPGVAYINSGFAFWVTDLRIFNPGVATPATLTFYPQGSPGAAVTREITLDAGEVEVLDNVIGGLFAQPNGAGGSILISTPSSTQLIATARTYNQTAHGTYGQYIPGVTPAESVGANDRALQILQLEQSSRFRTNIGLDETSGQSARVEVTLIVPDSIASPVVTYNLAANEFRQFSLADFNLGNAIYNARVTVKVTSGNGRVTAYGSAIDLVTQDPTYVPAQ